MINKQFAIKYFQQYWAENKAKGLLAEVQFLKFLVDKKCKIFKCGPWLLSPKKDDSYKYRFAVFPHHDYVSESDIKEVMQEVAGDYSYNRTACFLRSAGIETLYAVPIFGAREIRNINDDTRLQWKLFRLFDGKYTELEDTFFNSWRGRGRVSHPHIRMTEETINKYRDLKDADLSRLFLNEAFYTSFLKRSLKVPINDPYDVDGFFISYSGSVFPVELKEKSPGGEGNNRFFGIDVGRTIMMLHLCLPNNSNALYIIREVDDSPGRRFVGWKYITLSDLIMTAGWGGQQGGRAMGGGQTQTMLMPYGTFADFTLNTISVKSLNSIQNLTDDTKLKAQQFLSSIEEKYFRSVRNIR